MAAVRGVHGGGVHSVALDGGVVDIHSVIRRWRRGVLASSWAARRRRTEAAAGVSVGVGRPSVGRRSLLSRTRAVCGFVFDSSAGRHHFSFSIAVASDYLHMNSYVTNFEIR